MFTQLFSNTVSRYPDQVAITWKKENLTWRQLEASVKAVAGGLKQRDVQKGDNVALILDNTPAFIIAFLASIRLGAPVILINKSIQSTELFQIVSDIAIKVLICEKAHVPACRDVLSRVRNETLLLVNGGNLPDEETDFSSLMTSGDSAEWQPCDADDALVIQYSSGSTGRSKSLTRSHAMCVAEANNHRISLEIDASDSIFCTAPLFHCYAMGNCFFPSVATGARLILFSDASPFSLYRKQCLALIEQEKPSILVTVPYICAQLADIPEEYDLSSIRIATTAGTALSREIFNQFLMKYNIPLRQLYGCTEAGVIAVNLEKDVESTMSTVGEPIRGVSINIVDEQRQPVPAGTTGEVAISTEAMTRGYHGLPELNHRVFRDGFFYTGDLGWLDEAGRLTLTGRKTKFIEVHGHKVDPVEVEAVLFDHPSVDDVVVVGVSASAEDRSVERVKAVVVCRQSCDRQELIDWCRARLHNFKVPGLVQFVDEIPRNPMGKVLRKFLV